MTEKELDNLFKEKLGERQFEYNPDNWAAMTAMLDNDSKRKGGFYWWMTAAILVLGLVGAMFIPSSDETLPQQIANDKADTLKQAPATLQNNFKQPKPNTIAGENQNNDLTTTNPAIENHAATTKKSAEDATVISENSTNNAVSNTASRSSSDNKIASAKVTQNNISSIAESAPLREYEDVLSINNINPEFAYTLPDPSLEMAAPIKEQSNSVIPGFKPGALLSNQKGAYLQGGLSLMDSYDNNLLSYGAQVGLTYDINVFRRFGISTGILYSYNNNIGLAYSTDSVYFRFGREELHTDKSYTSIQSLQVPLELTWAVASQHRLSIGTYFSYITTVNEDVHQVLYEFKKEPVETTTTTNVAGTTFRKYNSGLRFGYTYIPNKLWQAGINLQYGLMDITNSSFNQRLAGEHNIIESNIYLRYRLF